MRPGSCRNHFIVCFFRVANKLGTIDSWIAEGCNMRSFPIKTTVGQGDPERLDGDFRSLLEKDLLSRIQIKIRVKYFFHLLE